MLRGLGCFLGIKWAVAVPIFTLFHFFLLQTYFYAKSHLQSILKSKKSDRWRKKCDQSTPALKTGGAMVWRFGRLTGLWPFKALSVAIRWQIPRNDHEKPWNGVVMASQITMCHVWTIIGTGWTAWRLRTRLDTHGWQWTAQLLK